MRSAQRLTFLLGWIFTTVAVSGQSLDPARPADHGLELVLSKLAAMEQRLSRIEAELGTPPGPIEALPAPPPEDSNIATRLEALDQQIRVVDRKRELDQEQLTTRFAEAPVVASSRDGFSLRSADGSFQFKIGGYFQADSRWFTGAGQPESSTFLLRRVRPVLTGTLYRGIEFRLMPDWGQGAAVLQDLHLDFRFFPKASVRFGKFKAPFSLERLQSATDMTFIERAYPTNLAPNRDTGVQVYGDFAGGTLSYAVAAMNGVADGASSDTDTNDGKDFVARVFVQPFLRKSTDHKGRGLGFGVAASRGRQTGSSLPAYRTTPQSTFFTYASGTAADGDRKRLGPQAYYYVGPFGVFGEYTIAAQDVRRGTATGTIRNRGWQVATSYLLTGESKGYRTLSPASPFDRTTGGRGALEIAGRYTELSIDPSAFSSGFADSSRSARRAQEWTAGINWYIVRGTRFIVNYSHTHFEDGATAGDRHAEQTLLTRFQVAF